MRIKGQFESSLKFLTCLTPFVLCPEEDGGIDSSVFHKMSIAPAFKPAVGRLREALMNNADARRGKKWGSYLLSFGIREADPHLKVWKEADGAGPRGRKCQGRSCWRWGVETCSVGSEQILPLNRGTTVIILLLQFSWERKAINSERHSGTVPLRPQRENENKGERTRERARGRKMVYKAFCFDNGMQAH